MTRPRFQRGDRVVFHTVIWKDGDWKTSIAVDMIERVGLIEGYETMPPGWPQSLIEVRVQVDKTSGNPEDIGKVFKVPAGHCYVIGDWYTPSRWWPKECYPHNIGRSPE
jgi:hypothetical protein